LSEETVTTNNIPTERYQQRNNPVLTHYETNGRILMKCVNKESQKKGETAALI